MDAINRHDRFNYRIAYIMSRFPKISETFILNEIVTMQQLGTDIRIFPLLRQKTKLRHKQAESLVQSAYFSPFLSPAIIKSQWYFIKKSPLRYIKLWIKRLWHSLPSANFFFGTLGILPKSVHNARLMLELDIKHIHAHFATHPTVSAMIIHELTGIPFSFTAHGSDIHVRRTMLCQKIARASFAVAISGYNRDLMLKTCPHIDADKIKMIHCGVDISEFTAMKKKNKTLHIINVARFEQVKGHTVLIRACRRLKNRDIPFSCHLIGHGPLFSAIQKQVKRMNLQDDITFYGNLTQDRVKEKLADADVFVLASVPTRSGKREGIPVVLMEAMATELAVISSRLSGIPELITHQHDGFLISPGDDEELAAILEKLYRKKELSNKWAKNASKRIFSDFNLLTNTRNKLLEMEKTIA